MFYEVSREIFKQRVEKPAGFAIIDLTKNGSGIKDTEKFAYSEKLISEISAKYPEKTQNILLFTLDEGDSSPKVTGQKLADEGYHFVYYYHGDKKQDELIGQN